MKVLTNELKSYRAIELSAGFTIIELILVIGVISIMAAVAVPNFFGARQKRALSAETDKIAAEVRGMMERSRAQEDGRQWWIRFENPAGTNNDFYAVCGGTYSGTPGASCDAEGGTQFSRKTLGSNVAFTDPADEATLRAIFQRSTGLPTAQTTLVLNSGALAQTIIINTNGRIDIQ